LLVVPLRKTRSFTRMGDSLLILSFLWVGQSSAQGVSRAPGTPQSSFRKLPSAPEAPAGFRIESGDGLVRLKWNPTPHALGYVVYVSEDAKTFKPDSTSKCNTPPKDLCRGGKSKTLSRPIV
jgi:hypothetical protein